MNFPHSTASRKPCQSGNVTVGPAGFFESRTRAATPAGETSTQLELFPLLRWAGLHWTG